MKKNCAILLLFIVAIIHSANTQTAADIKKSVNEVLKSTGMTHASLSVAVYNITKKETIYSYQSKMSLIPGSLNKLFTTAIGFKQLGSEFRFKTTLAYDGFIDQRGTLNGNLYIIGGGDPMLGSYRFKQTTPDTLFSQWTTVLKKRGIHHINGRIFYYSGIFDNKPLHNSWAWGDIGNYYGAGAYGLNFHENMYFVYFNPGKGINYPATVSQIAPKALNVRGYNEVTTAAKGTGDQVTIYGEPNSNIRHYCGTVPLDKNNFSVRGAMPSPPKSCAELFADFLRAHDVPVSNNVAECTNLPSGLTTLLEHHSNTYYVIAQYTNQSSNNIYAESIFKYLGYQTYKKGSFENGRKCINQYLKNNNINTSGVQIIDGCGLSRNNLVTADFVCRFLTHIQSTPEYTDFSNSLSRIRESGTARNMLKDIPKNIDVALKSGTLDNVKAYAGYITNEQKEILCFCIISNNHTCNNTEIKTKMEKILQPIALYRSK